MSTKEFWKSCDNKRLENLLLITKDASKLKHIQVVYLKSCYDMKAEDIARITGFSKGYVWAIHSKYRGFGDKAFELSLKGGAYHRNLSNEQEELLIQEAITLGDSGKILEISMIKKNYEELAGKQVHKSVVYRMLARHGWRKIAPRPVHPKNDKLAMETFKKTFPKWCKIA
jgi:transposase